MITVWIQECVKRFFIMALISYVEGIGPLGGLPSPSHFLIILYTVLNFFGFILCKF